MMRNGIRVAGMLFSLLQISWMVLVLYTGKALTEADGRKSGRTAGRFFRAAGGLAALSLCAGWVFLLSRPTFSGILVLVWITAVTGTMLFLLFRESDLLRLSERVVTERKTGLLFILLSSGASIGTVSLVLLYPQ